MTDTAFDSWGEAIKVADAVLYEGYMLYPYRASSDKNRLRWQFGVLVPPTVSAHLGESSFTRTEALCEVGARATLRLRARFLHVMTRSVEVRGADGAFTPVPRLTIGDTEHISWDEAVERDVEAEFPIAGLLTAIAGVPFEFPGGVEVEELDGARVVRRCEALRGLITASASPLDGPFDAVRLRVVISNTTPAESAQTRQAILPTSLIGTHMLLGVAGGHFLSLTDPPEWAREATDGLANEGAWPVLVGSPERRDTMLSAPIILYDFPTIAPESPQPLFDGTEIDEILTLRTMTLTDEEKRQARASDGRVGSLLDGIDAMPPELLDRLHGTIRYLRRVAGGGSEVMSTGERSEVMSAGERSEVMSADAQRVDTSVNGNCGDATANEALTPWWDPSVDGAVAPETDVVIIDGGAISKGSRVELQPRLHGADAQDMFLVGKTATVQAVVLDVDGSHHVAVTVDDDPANDVHVAQGRFRYFAPTELRPVRTTEAGP
jgi:hypothetical protein